ncbi:hypothetical protein ACFLR2_00235 [Chlamydiota bacterium]
MPRISIAGIYSEHGSAGLTEAGKNARKELIGLTVAGAAVTAIAVACLVLTVLTIINPRGSIGIAFKGLTFLGTPLIPIGILWLAFCHHDLHRELSNDEKQHLIAANLQADTPL